MKWDFSTVWIYRTDSEGPHGGSLVSPPTLQHFEHFSFSQEKNRLKCTITWAERLCSWTFCRRAVWTFTSVEQFSRLVENWRLLKETRMKTVFKDFPCVWWNDHRSKLLNFVFTDLTDSDSYMPTHADLKIAAQIHLRGGAQFCFVGEDQWVHVSFQIWELFSLILPDSIKSLTSNTDSSLTFLFLLPLCPQSFPPGSVRLLLAWISFWGAPWRG